MSQEMIVAYLSRRTLQCMKHNKKKTKCFKSSRLVLTDSHSVFVSLRYT